MSECDPLADLKRFADEVGKEAGVAYPPQTEIEKKIAIRRAIYDWSCHLTMMGVRDAPRKIFEFIRKAQNETSS